MAALTPQIDTADASSARSLSSSPRTPPSHQVKPNTMDDQQQRLDDRRTGRGDEHLQVDGRAEQHQAGLDEELGAEALRQCVAQRQLGQHEVADQSQSDCVDGEFDGLGDPFERRAVRPLRNLRLQEPGGGAQRDDDEHAGDRVADARRAGLLGLESQWSAPSRDHAARDRSDEYKCQQGKAGDDGEPILVHARHRMPSLLAASPVALSANRTCTR